MRQIIFFLVAFSLFVEGCAPTCGTGGYKKDGTGRYINDSSGRRVSKYYYNYEDSPLPVEKNAYLKIKPFKGTHYFDYSVDGYPMTLDLLNPGQHNLSFSLWVTYQRMYGEKIVVSFNFESGKVYNLNYEYSLDLRKWNAWITEETDKHEIETIFKTLSQGELCRLVCYQWEYGSMCYRGEEECIKGDGSSRRVHSSCLGR